MSSELGQEDASTKSVVSESRPSEADMTALKGLFLAEGLPTLTSGHDPAGQFFSGIGSTLGQRVAETWRSRRAVRAAALREAPVVLVLLVFLFVTSETWRLFGPGGTGRLPAVVVLFLLFGVAVLVSSLANELGGVYRTATKPPPEKLRVAARHIPEAKPLLGVELPPNRKIPYFRLNRRQQFNIGLVLATPLFVIASLVGLITFVTFVIVGFVGIDETLTREWIGAPSSQVGADLSQGHEPHIWISWSILDQQFILTKELIRVSIFLAAIAALAFTNNAIRDKELGNKLIAPTCVHLKRLVAAWVFYKEANRQ
jgi:hypothetical protein